MIAWNDTISFSFLLKDDAWLHFWRKKKKKKAGGKDETEAAAEANKQVVISFHSLQNLFNNLQSTMFM